MSKNVIMIHYRTSKDWSTLKVEARPSLPNAVEFLYNTIIHNTKVGDITMDGTVFTTTEIVDLYAALLEAYSSQV